MGAIFSRPNDNQSSDQPAPPAEASAPVATGDTDQGGEHGHDYPRQRPPGAGEGPNTGSTFVQDNLVVGDPSKVVIGEGNYGGRTTGGSVTGNRVMR